MVNGTPPSPSIQTFATPSYRTRWTLLLTERVGSSSPGPPAYLGGLGRPYWVLQVFSLQNALCWVVIGILLFRWFPKRDGRAFALWFACLFNGAVLGSTLGALLGLPSMLLIMLGVIALEEERRLLSGLIFGLAGLGRETNVLGAAAPA